jgi:hypothetical protein
MMIDWTSVFWSVTIGYFVAAIIYHSFKSERIEHVRREKQINEFRAMEYMNEDELIRYEELKLESKKYLNTYGKFYSIMKNIRIDFYKAITIFTIIVFAVLFYQYSQNGRYRATKTARGQVVVYDSRTGEEVQE